MVDEATQNNETTNEDITSADTIADATSNPELNINDLAAMKSIIDVASSRGAFKPNEMVPVGTVYAKLESFLAAAQAATAQAKPNA
jgi:hypothetical protein